MSYYWFNKNELLEKAEEKYHNCGDKEKTATYYKDNKDAIKEKLSIRICQKKKKKKKEAIIQRQISKNERKCKFIFTV